MHEIKICVCLYFLITFIVVTMGSDGWMIMALDCGWGGEGSKINLNYYDNV